jgi:hypothetical protein
MFLLSWDQQKGLVSIASPTDRNLFFFLIIETDSVSKSLYVKNLKAVRIVPGSSHTHTFKVNIMLYKISVVSDVAVLQI